MASLELSKELYELSGWKDTDNKYGNRGSRPSLAQMTLAVPAYDLGYLLRKLPPIYSRKNGGVEKYWYLELAIMQNIDTNKSDGWEASYQSIKDSEGILVIKNVDMIAFADTPENAATKLAIELFKQGVLK